MSTRPNILFVLVDQMRSTAMGCAGVEGVHTPHLDRLAGEGTRFVNAVSNTPACTPARACLLTGKHTLHHRLINNDLQLGHDHRTLAHCLTDAGYRCGYIGKWHVDGVNRGAYIPPGPRRQGFDDFWAGTECNHNYFAGYYYDDATRQPVWFDGYEPDGQTDLAVRYLRQRAAERSDASADPFCLFVSYSPPHCPYEQVPQEHLDRYPPESIELLPNARDARVQSGGSRGRLARTDDAPQAAHDARKRELIAGYYAHVTALDACVGRLLGALEEGGLTEDTLVVFTSDHGDMLFSHNRGWKVKPWRESVGIPLLMRWGGGIPCGRTTRGPISLVDLAPTLLDLAGVPVPPEMDGRALGAFVRGDESARAESVWINFPAVPAYWGIPPWRGVVTERHTYVATPDGPWLLHDDVTDPFQMDNLAHRVEHREIERNLDLLLHDWLRRTDDDFASPREFALRYAPGCNLERLEMPSPPLPDVIREGQGKRARGTGH